MSVSGNSGRIYSRRNFTNFRLGGEVRLKEERGIKKRQLEEDFKRERSEAGSKRLVGGTGRLSRRWNIEKKVGWITR